MRWSQSKPGKSLHDPAKGQPNNTVVTTLDALNRVETGMLDSIAARLIKRVPAVDIGLDIFIRVSAHPNPCVAEIRLQTA